MQHFNKNKGSSTVVITVPTLTARDMLVRKLYTHLTKEPSTMYSIVQDRLNRIQIFQLTKNGIRILIKTYLVIIIPVQIDLSPIMELSGSVDFHLDDTIAQLQKLIAQLKSLQGKHVLKGTSCGKTLEQLVRVLSDINV
jgi:hypothetical protein